MTTYAEMEQFIAHQKIQWATGNSEEQGYTFERLCGMLITTAGLLQKTEDLRRTYREAVDTYITGQAEMGDLSDAEQELADACGIEVTREIEIEVTLTYSVTATVPRSLSKAEIEDGLSWSTSDFMLDASDDLWVTETDSDVSVTFN